MLSRFLILLMLFAAVTLPLGRAAGADEVFDLRNGPRDGLLLLRNGHVLYGRVSRAAERYYVVTATGEIRLPIEQAETFCLNLNAAYRYKRAAINPRKAADRRTLAVWCLQQQLFPRAAEELSAAERLQPNHRTTRYLQQRLQLALHPPTRPAAPPKQDTSRPSSAQLARFVKSLPPGTIETFTHRIQPLLLNRCASCHGRPGASDFVLRRLPRGRPLDHRVTQANLFAALQRIDSENPEQSSLLTTLLRPHGGSRAALFADQKQPQYQRLAAWVHDLAKAKELLQVKPKTLSTSSGPLLQVMDQQRTGETSASVTEPRRTKGDKEATAAVAPTEEDRSRRSEAGRFTPRDPFDPEVFNRRFFSPPVEKDRPSPLSGKNAKDDRRINFGVGPRPSSRPQPARRPTE